MRSSSALIIIALLPACGMTERCSKETKPYAAPGREEVPIIAPDVLQGTLPHLEGWGTPSTTSELKTLGTQQISSASVVYERRDPLAGADPAAAPSAAPNPNAAPSSSAAAPANAVGPSLQRVSIDIVDGRYIAEAYAPFAVLMHYRGEVAEPHKRAIHLAGHPGVEQWTPETGGVRVLLLVGQRFIVTLDGSNLTPPEVKAWLNAVDVSQLGSWGKPTTPAPASSVATDE